MVHPASKFSVLVSTVQSDPLHNTAAVSSCCAQPLKNASFTVSAPDDFTGT